MSLVTSGNYSTPVAATYHSADTDIYSRQDSFTGFLQDLNAHRHRLNEGLGVGRLGADTVTTANIGEVQTVTGGLIIADGTSQNTLLDIANNGTPKVKVTGITGATAASRYVGATTGGAPVSGTFAVGDYIIDQTGFVYICTTAGSPGTWKNSGLASGTITLWPSTTAPASNSGFICNGQAISRTTYAGIFAIMGTTYGVGNGTTTFNLPDMVGRTAFGADAGASRITSNNTLGASGGAYSVTLSAAQSGLPAHRHNLNSSGGLSISDPGHAHAYHYAALATGGGGGATPAASGSSLNTDTNTTGITIGGTTEDYAGANAGSATTLMNPYLIVNYVVWS